MIFFSLFCENGRKPLQAAAAKELDEKSLAQVGAAVGGGHAGAGNFAGQRGEKIIARKRGGVLQVQAVFPAEALQVTAADLQFDGAVRRRKRAPSFLLPWRPAAGHG